MKQRTKARALALEVLYEVDLAGHLPGQVFSQRLADRAESGNAELTEELVAFANEIVTGVIHLATQLDHVIEVYAPEWPFDQVPAIDRNILRIATWEFAVTKHTPTEIAINEAVELAKEYGSDTTSKFVNGVLGSLADHEDEIHAAFVAL